MRVLHVYSGNLFGGIESLLVTFARHSGSLSHEFALCSEGRLSTELREASAPVHLLGHVRISRPNSIVAARRRLRRLIEKGSYAAVVLHAPWSSSLFGNISRAHGAIIASWLHDVVGRHPLDYLASRREWDLLICNSAFTASTVSRSYAGHPEVVHCAVRPTPTAGGEERARIRKEQQVPDDALVVVQVSRMEEWKGHVVHLEALAELRDHPGWVAWIVGGAQRPKEQQYEARLRALARSLGIADRVSFLGQRNDVPLLLSSADVFCQPNTSPEPFGIALVEALYSGLPVVTSDIGGAREIVDESCGIRTMPGSPVATASALRRLFDDPALRAQLSSAAPAHAKRISDPAQQERRLHELFSERRVELALPTS